MKTERIRLTIEIDAQRFATPVNVDMLIEDLDEIIGSHLEDVGMEQGRLTITKVERDRATLPPNLPFTGSRTAP